MKKLFLIAMTAVLFASCGKKQETTNLYTPDPEGFDYVVDAFADMQIMRYRVTGIETLSISATIAGVARTAISPEPINSAVLPASTRITLLCFNPTSSIYYYFLYVILLQK